jgi:hypothetical protein
MKFEFDVRSQLANLNAWSSANPKVAPVSLFDYAGLTASPDTLFSFAEFFLPELVEWQGRKFLASRFDHTVYAAWQSKLKSGREIQRVMNHIHISWLLQNDEISDELAVAAAGAIRDIWQRTLGPEGLISESLGRGLEDASVTFFSP